MSDFVDVFAAGVAAYNSGLDESANPYDLATQELAHLEWHDGWNSASDEEEPF